MTEGLVEVVLLDLGRLDFDSVKGLIIGKLKHDEACVAEVLIIITAADELIMVNDSWLPVMAT